MRLLYKSYAAAFISCLMLAMVFLAPTTAHSSEWDRMTKFTVNHPFEVPGMTLQPNTRYTMRLLDQNGTRNVVEVLNADQTKLLTHFMAISDERLEPVDKTTFTFIETEPGYPMPIKEWFYPGRNIGLEFIYPKEQALEIARHAREPILAAESVNLHDLASIRIESIGPLGTEAVPTTATAENGPKAELPPVEEAKPTPAPEPVPDSPVVEEQPQQPSEAPAIAELEQPEIQQPVAPAPAPEAAPASTEETNTRELPKTAGELPLIALIGALCLGAGIGLKVLSVRS